MRHLMLALTLALASILGFGAVAPSVHAQAYCCYSMPTVTVTPSTVTYGSTAVVQGRGFSPYCYAYVYYQRPDGTTNAFYVTTDAYGQFAFNLGFSPAHGTGSEYVSAYDYNTGRWANFAVVTVTGTTPPPTTRTVTASPNPVTIGNTSTVTGTGFTPNNYVYFSYTRPDNTTNAFYVYTDASGTFMQRLGFLRAHGCGTETVRAYDYATGTATTGTITVTGC